MADRDLKDIVADLDIVASWYGTGSSQYRKVKGLADELAEKAGGRKALAAGDPAAPTPGPGVKTPAPIEVDKVGDIADTPDVPPKQLGSVTSAVGSTDLPH